jgi:FMN-dependent NADH-azoreductase
VTDIQFIRAEGVALGQESKDQAMAQAAQAIEQLMEEQLAAVA